MEQKQNTKKYDENLKQNYKEVLSFLNGFMKGSYTEKQINELTFRIEGILLNTEIENKQNEVLN
jgi:hypothetical protein